MSLLLIVQSLKSANLIVSFLFVLTSGYDSLIFTALFDTLLY